MFYCKKCSKKLLMPGTIIRSTGVCGVCGDEKVECYLMDTEKFYERKNYRDELLRNCFVNLEF